MAIDLRETARDAARATLERRWTKERFELELELDHEPRWSHVFERSHYGAVFRVFEVSDAVSVTLGTSGEVTRARLLPSADETRDPGPVIEPAPAALERARHAALDTARRSGLWHVLRSRVVEARPIGARGEVDVLVRVLGAAPEGALTIDLDAVTGEKVGYFVPFWLRGSSSGKALSKREVAARVQADLPPDAGLRLARAELEEPAGARLWRLRYEAHGKRAGLVILCAHARTGLIAGMTLTLRPRARAARGASRERALRLVERALPHVVGPGARLGSLVPGLIVSRGARPGWVGTAITDEGAIVRVSLCNDEVEARVGGKVVRASVLPSRVLVHSLARHAPEKAVVEA